MCEECEMPRFSNDLDSFRSGELSAVASAESTAVAGPLKTAKPTNSCQQTNANTKINDCFCHDSKVTSSDL